MFPSQTGKILFTIWGTPVFLFFLISYLLNWKFPLIVRINFTDISFFALIVYVIIHAFFLNPVCIHPFFLVEILSLSAFYILIRLIPLFSSTTFYLTLIITSLGQATWGLFQHFGLLPSQHNMFVITGTFFNSAPYSGYLATMLPLIVGILLIVKSIPLDQHVIFTSPCWRDVIKYALKSILVLCILMLYLASSRAAWLASFSSMLFLFHAIFISSGAISMKINNYFGKGTVFQQKCVTWGYVIFVISITTVCTWYLFRMRPESANGRLLIWKATLGMITNHPMLGIGAGQFCSQYMHYQASYLCTTTHPYEKILADNNILTFNDPLRMLAEFGIPGLLMAFGTLLSAFGGMLKNKHSSLVIIARSGLIALVVFSLFSYPASVVPLMILTIFFLALIAREQSTRQITIPLGPKLIINIVLCTLLIFLTVFSTLQAFRLTWACRQWKIVAENKKLYGQAENLEVLKEIYPILKNDGFFTTLYGHRLLLSGKYVEAERMLQEAATLLPTSDIYLDWGECFLNLGKVVEAEQTYLYALQMIPNRAKPVKALALLYLQTRRNQDARCLLEDYMESNLKKNAIGSYQIELELRELYKRTE